MAIIITESDCDFLKDTYSPTSKVEMRLKSILVKMGVGFMNLNEDVIKEIYYSGSDVPISKTENKITLSALVSDSFEPAFENTKYKEGFNYIPVLNGNNKIPSKMIPASVITDIYVYDVTEREGETGTWEEIITWLKNNQDIKAEKGDVLIVSNVKDKVGAYFIKENFASDIPTPTGNDFDYEEYLAKIPSPVGCISSITINGITYLDKDLDGIVNLGNVLNNIDENDKGLEVTTNNGISTLSSKPITDRLDSLETIEISSPEFSPGLQEWTIDNPFGNSSCKVKMYEKINNEDEEIFYEEVGFSLKINDAWIKAYLFLDEHKEQGKFKLIINK